MSCSKHLHDPCAQLVGGKSSQNCIFTLATQFYRVKRDAWLAGCPALQSTIIVK